MFGGRSTARRTCGGGEVSHEGGVVVGVWELLFDLALPRHLHKVDADAVRHHLRTHAFMSVPVLALACATASLLHVLCLEPVSRNSSCNCPQDSGMTSWQLVLPLLESCLVMSLIHVSARPYEAIDRRARSQAQGTSALTETDSPQHISGFSCLSQDCHALPSWS